MPFKKHPAFKSPKNEEVKIWRYTDLGKFLHLIISQSLYFSRIDLLSKDDPYEGLYTKRLVDLCNLKYSDLSEERRIGYGMSNEIQFNSIIELYKKTLTDSKNLRDSFFVNCWHINDFESMAMWKLYSHYNQGIAIQSSYSKLIKSMESNSKFDVHIGIIEYIDYEKGFIPDENVLSPIMYKRKSFKHEEELRAVIWIPENSSIWKNKNKLIINDIALKLCLPELIENIYVSPDSPNYIIEIIESILSKYQIEINVMKSKLNDPLY